MTFNAITKNAVTEAMANPREIDQPLVDAYLARRALDYLVGFNLSPVLWRKLPGAKSAGRVQSVALRIIVDREMEIEAFRAREYWTVHATLATPAGAEYQAQLVTYAGRKLDRYDLADAEAAALAVSAVQSRDLKVMDASAISLARLPRAKSRSTSISRSLKIRRSSSALRRATVARVGLAVGLTNRSPRSAARMASTKSAMASFFST